MMDRLCVCRPAAVFLALGIFALGRIQSIPAAQPILSHPVWNADPLHAQINVTNCSNTNVQYVIQMSTNLINWTPVITNQAAPTNFSVIVPTANNACYYRAVTIAAPVPIFNVAIVVKSNFYATSTGGFVDSFDSSNPAFSTSGQWDLTKRKAGGNVATPSSTIMVGNASIYGYVNTGPGSVQSAVQVGPDGSIGDIAWNANETGIEPSGYWAGNFNVAVPDVSAPTFAGASLPTASNGRYNS